VRLNTEFYSWDTSFGLVNPRPRYSRLQVVFCVNLGTFSKCFLQLGWRLTGVRSTLPECSLIVHCMCTECSPIVHGMFTTGSRGRDRGRGQCQWGRVRIQRRHWTHRRVGVFAFVSHCLLSFHIICFRFTLFSFGSHYLRLRPVHILFYQFTLFASVHIVFLRFTLFAFASGSHYLLSVHIICFCFRFTLFAFAFGSHCLLVLSVHIIRFCFRFTLFAFAFGSHCLLLLSVHIICFCLQFTLFAFASH
jgi:hypothetical protein